MSEFAKKLVPIQESLLLQAAIEAENLQIEPLHEVMQRMEIMGTMISSLCDFRDPLVLLMEREDRGEFHWHDSITGLAA